MPTPKDQILYEKIKPHKMKKRILNELKISLNFKPISH
jgi:hypothetical protein